MCFINVLMTLELHGDEIQVSGDDSDTSIGSRISFSGSNVYVAWEQYEDDAIYRTVFVKSSNGGDSFGDADTLSNTNSVSEIAITSQ